VQMGGVTSSKEKNLARAKELIARAASPGNGAKPGVIVLPECFNSPYGTQFFPEYCEVIGYKPGETYDAASSPSGSVKMLSAAAKEAGVWLIGGSIPEKSEEDGKLYNTATIYSPKGELVGIHRKVHLFDIDIPGKITFKESETLTGGSSVTLIDTDYGRIGIGICYDIRFPELAMIAARKGAIAMIYPGAFNLTTGPLHWELLQRGRAVDNQIYVSMCSPARDMTAGYHAWGHSTVVDPMGAVIATTEHEEDIIYADIEPTKLEAARGGIPVTTQRRFDVYKDVAADS